MPLLTTNVTSTYVDPSLTPIAGVPVVATLKGPITSLSGTSVKREEVTRTDLSGRWTLGLLPNSLFGEDSYYLIKVGTKEEYQVKVPITINSTPVELSTIILNGLEDTLKSIFVGKMQITGDLVVNGNVNVTGNLVTGSQSEYTLFGINDIPTFPGSLEVVGDLIVSGELAAKGTITVGI